MNNQALDQISFNQPFDCNIASASVEPLELALKYDRRGSEASVRRSRASPEQLAILQDAFEKNPNPNMSIRKELAAKCNMPEKSVQIWFQNKRARSKTGRKGSRNGSVGSIEYRRNKSFSPHSSFSSAAENISAKFSLSGQSLSIGTWTRGLNPIMNDLKFFVIPNEEMFRWQLEDSGHSFRVDIPFVNVVRAEAKVCEDMMMEIQFELASAPSFYMMQLAQFSWKMCTDFSEGAQASTVLVHKIKGPRFLMESELSAAMKQVPFLASILTFDSTLMASMALGSPFSNQMSATPAIDTGLGLKIFDRRNSMPVSLNDSYLQSASLPNLHVSRGSLVDSPLFTSLSTASLAYDSPSESVGGSVLLSSEWAGSPISADSSLLNQLYLMQPEISTPEISAADFNKMMGIPKAELNILDQSMTELTSDVLNFFM